MMKHPNVMARYEVDKFFKIAYHIRRERCTPSQTEYEIDAVSGAVVKQDKDMDGR